MSVKSTKHTIRVRGDWLRIGYLRLNESQLIAIKAQDITKNGLHLEYVNPSAWCAEVASSSDEGFYGAISVFVDDKKVAAVLPEKPSGEGNSLSNINVNSIVCIDPSDASEYTAEIDGQFDIKKLSVTWETCPIGIGRPPYVLGSLSYGDVEFEYDTAGGGYPEFAFVDEAGVPWDIFIHEDDDGGGWFTTNDPSEFEETEDGEV